MAVTNYKSGIDVTWGGTEGTDWAEEYWYHDKLRDDHKVVYIKSTTAITMAHNALNQAQYHTAQGGNQIIGVNGRDGIADSGDEGQIRYNLDRDRQYKVRWAANYAGTDSANVAAAYTAPFTLASLEYESGVPVVGTTGHNGGSVTSQTARYYRGIVDPFGDEWHTLAYADDDSGFLDIRNPGYESQGFVDVKFWASDGKTVLLVVNPKTPCLTVAVTGDAQFYTTPPKAYYTPKVVAQTTYISAGTGSVSITLHDINGNNVFWRIGGGSFTDAGSATKVLTAADFSTGSNTLEYYYAGNAAYTKTRTVVKDPTHPSLAESHGDYLWVDSTGYSTVLDRITRAPYKATFDGYKAGNSATGQSAWDSYGHQGNRFNGGASIVSNGHPFCAALRNAFVAKVEGFTYTKSGGAMSHGEYAIDMLLDQPALVDMLGWELQPSGDVMPSRDLNLIGYYDSVPAVEAIFAYDIIVANFRDNQVTGGITAIDDYFVRDVFGKQAYKSMLWSADMVGGGGGYKPGMWGGAHYMEAISIGIIMREYTSPVFGTSGFGTVQTTYPLCPYETDELTWKEALFDETTTTSAFPNYCWPISFSKYDAVGDVASSDSLFLKSGITGYKEGDWWARDGYFVFGTMGYHMCTYANMALQWVGSVNSRLIVGLVNAASGTLDTYYDKTRPGYTGPFRHTMLTALNARFPDVVSAGLAWTQGLSSTNNDSDDKAMQDAGVFGFAWYDDQLPSDPEDPGDVTAPTPDQAEIDNVAVFGDGLRITATTASDASGTVIYEFSCVEAGETTFWLPSQSSNVFTIIGLLPATLYDCRVRAKDLYGNTTAQSGITQQTTAAADSRPRRSPRGRGMPY